MRIFQIQFVVVIIFIYRYDYVEVFDGSVATSPRLGRYCHSVPNSIVSTGNALLVRFRSDYSQSGRGFHARYVIGEKPRPTQ